jgi:hypothetical protein
VKKKEGMVIMPADKKRLGEVGEQPHTIRIFTDG